MSTTVYVTQCNNSILVTSSEKQLKCAISLHLTKNIHIERIENLEIFTEGQADMNMHIQCIEISYKSNSQNLAFRLAYLLIFEGQNS